MAYINGNSVRLTVLDNGSPVAVLYEQESTLNVNANITDLPHKDSNQWLVRQPFGLKDWSIDCTRFYSDDNDNAPLNFNEAVELLISGDQIQVEYNIGDADGTIYEGFARVNTDALTAQQSEALIATVNLMGDGYLRKLTPIFPLIWTQSKGVADDSIPGVIIGMEVDPLPPPGGWAYAGDQLFDFSSIKNLLIQFDGTSNVEARFSVDLYNETNNDPTLSPDFSIDLRNLGSDFFVEAGGSTDAQFGYNYNIGDVFRLEMLDNNSIGIYINEVLILNTTALLTPLGNVRIRIRTRTSSYALDFSGIQIQ